MTIDKAIEEVEHFKDRFLADKVARMETDFVGATQIDVGTLLNNHGISAQFLLAAGEVKRASAQIDVVIHAAALAYALPHILQTGEVVENCSLGAGNAGSNFDLESSHRIAEFKFIRWQGGSEAGRKKALFQDFYKLARHDTKKHKQVFLLNTEIPQRYLRGRSSCLNLLSGNQRLRADFQLRFGNTYQLVGDFYNAFEEEIQLVDLTQIIPGMKTFLEMFEQDI